jgi:hypothetical protein
VSKPVSDPWFESMPCDLIAPEWFSVPFGLIGSEWFSVPVALSDPRKYSARRCA